LQTSTPLALVAAHLLPYFLAGARIPKGSTNGARRS
jgi:hypothetical protein